MTKYVPSEKEVVEVEKAIAQATDKQELMKLRAIVENWKEDKDHGDFEKLLGRRR